MTAISAYNIINSDGSNPITIVETGIAIHSEKCYDENGIDLSGSLITDSLGRMTWRLSNFLCKERGVLGSATLDSPVSFVATPQTDKPAYITAKGAIQTGPPDLIIEVYSWDRLGEPAPDLPFYWRCRVPLHYTIL
jgi:hypothetical protein